MKFNYNNMHSKIIFIFFLFLYSNNFLFLTTKVDAKAFKIENIEISQPFEINFNKDKILDEGFKKAFNELILLTVTIPNQKKIGMIKLNEIKGIIESFSVKEEKFINQVYYVNIGVTFNKKKYFYFLDKKNIFPSLPKKKKFLFIPIIIDQRKKDLLVFSNNKIFNEWKNHKKTYHLIDYILPEEDLEDLNIIKKNFEFIENYDFKEITNKYFLEDSIVAVIFINNFQIRVLSRITLKDNVILKNQTFEKIDIDNHKSLKILIENLKNIYEDYWKNYNQINTSIKLPISIKIKTEDKSFVSKFEKTLQKLDLIYESSIYKFDKDYIHYAIVFNGSPNIFLKSMKDYNFLFDTQSKIWTLK